jgi:hypothetical protein
MQLQYGGRVRYEKIIGAEDFSFDGGFSDLRPELNHYITNFRDYILATCDKDDLAEAQKNYRPISQNA